MISIGTKAPNFTATIYNNGNKESLSSEDLAGSWYVIYWWPFDFTGICNSEIIGFQELEKEFAELANIRKKYIKLEKKLLEKKAVWEALKRDE